MCTRKNTMLIYLVLTIFLDTSLQTLHQIHINKKLNIKTKIIFRRLIYPHVGNTNRCNTFIDRSICLLGNTPFRVVNLTAWIDQWGNAIPDNCYYPPFCRSRSRVVWSYNKYTILGWTKSQFACLFWNPSSIGKCCSWCICSAKTVHPRSEMERNTILFFHHR